MTQRAPPLYRCLGRLWLLKKCCGTDRCGVRPPSSVVGQGARAESVTRTILPELAPETVRFVAAGGDTTVLCSKRPRSIWYRTHFRADVHHPFFSCKVLDLINYSICLTPKLVLEQKKIHGQGIQRKTYIFFGKAQFRRFLGQELRSPVFRKPFSQKKVYPEYLYRSTRRTYYCCVGKGE